MMQTFQEEHYLMNCGVDSHCNDIKMKIRKLLRDMHRKFIKFIRKIDGAPNPSIMSAEIFAVAKKD